MQEPCFGNAYCISLIFSLKGTDREKPSSKVFSKVSITVRTNSNVRAQKCARTFLCSHLRKQAVILPLHIISRKSFTRFRATQSDYICSIRARNPFTDVFVRLKCIALERHIFSVVKYSLRKLSADAGWRNCASPRPGRGAQTPRSRLYRSGISSKYFRRHNFSPLLWQFAQTFHFCAN